MLLRGRTIINCSFENSARARTSFEVAGKRLGGDVISMSVSANSMVKGEALIETAMALEFAEKTIVKDSVGGTECVFLAGLYQAEKGIADRILRLAAGKPSWPEIDAAKAIEWLAAKSPFSLADSQKQAVELALRSKVLVITGGPGVGKTTIVNSILRSPKTR